MILLKILLIALTFLSLSVKANDPYMAKSVEQYIETCQGAFDCLAKVSPELSHLGRDVDNILSFYKDLALKAADKKGKLTLQTYRLQLAYIAFKKVLKACEYNNLELIRPLDIKEGSHNEFSPILGIKSDSMKNYEKFAQKNPEFIRFGNSLYHQNPNCPGEASGKDLPATSMTMLPANLKETMNVSSQQDLNSYLQQHNLLPSQVFEEVSNFRAGVVYTVDRDNKWNSWRIHVMVDPKGAYNKRFNAYVPPQVVTLHELCHVEHELPGSPEHKTTSYRSSIVEIPCVIDQIILQDKLYKQAKGIPINNVVNYQNPTQTNRPDSLNPGTIANKFRGLKSKNGGDILKALMSTEGQSFVRSYFESSPSCVKPKVQANRAKRMGNKFQGDINSFKYR